MINPIKSRLDRDFPILTQHKLKIPSFPALLARIRDLCRLNVIFTWSCWVEKAETENLSSLRAGFPWSTWTWRQMRGNNLCKIADGINFLMKSHVLLDEMSPLCQHFQLRSRTEHIKCLRKGRLGFLDEWSSSKGQMIQAQLPLHFLSLQCIAGHWNLCSNDKPAPNERSIRKANKSHNCAWELLNHIH